MGEADRRGKHKSNDCCSHGQCCSISGQAKPDFRRIRQLSLLYSSRKCLKVQIEPFSQTDKPITLLWLPVQSTCIWRIRLCTFTVDFNCV